ncbi:hypothetical protein GTO91_16500 [Heliobacterium undosum]|uniref:Methyl-accepting transducer domain-containing protein n=1 Tax=Heliomicrobium undosum TaxID=121734 RepID=A0A845L7P2_9FIRM|nr:methyl-accepting chemotaxis protein [Heliomicrobium undosum]MZP31309.1 hypothetical protein [Heliomicrobium undosum]
MIKGKDLVDAFITIGPYLSRIISKDMMFCVTDREKFLAYFPGEIIDVKQNTGATVPKEDPIHLAMDTKQVIVGVVPREAYGFPFKATVTPILDDDENVIGCIGVGLSMETEDRSIHLSNEINSFMSDLHQNIEQIVTASETIKGNVNELTSRIQTISESVQQINKVLGFISKISGKTKMLGINASIESARIGVEGRGFQIVAEEIRKLSDESQKTAKLIQTLTSNITDGIKTCADSVSHSLESTENQNEILQKITSTIQELRLMSGELAKVAGSL